MNRLIEESRQNPCFIGWLVFNNHGGIDIDVGSMGLGRRFTSRLLKSVPGPAV